MKGYFALIALAPLLGAAEDDVPGRVARISLLQGPVSFRAAGTTEWTGAVLNRPLTTGDSLWTDRGARAELTLGTAAIRLDARSAITLLNLGDEIAQVELERGSARVTIRSVEGRESFEIDTPVASIALIRPGEYRAEAGPEMARLTVRTGVADIATSGEPVTVRAGQSAAVGSRNGPVEMGPAPPLDSFDTWCEDRERRPAAAAHVSRSTVGWEDLDAHGEWSEIPPYGPVWTPRVGIDGWAPYRFGHWVWIEPWGWTWVDDAPWGFAPFHYGRWVFARARWCWIPGPPRVRAIYSPALVVFAGGGNSKLRYHVSVGVGLGIAWFPLGPGEIYVPPYRHSATYVTNINISHTVIRGGPAGIARVDPARQVYAHRRTPGAVTTVAEDVFVSGRRIGSSARPMADRDAARTRVAGSAAPVAPSRRSVTGDPGARPSRPPESGASRPPVVRRTPPPRQPDFERRQPELQRNPGVPPAQRRAEPPARTHDRPSGQDERRRREIDKEHKRTR